MERTIMMIIAMVMSVTSSGEVPTVDLRGAGASFPQVVYGSWFPYFKALRAPYVDLNMPYDVIGSSGGRKRIMGILEPEVEYAGSDSLLTEEEYASYPDLYMFPSMAGAVVVAFNLPDIKSINLTREHLVGIYNGTITMWNDTSIQLINPEIILPRKSIIPIARSDKSGTTEMFTAAFSSFSPAWNATYGTFEKGLDANDEPYFWDVNAVKHYAYSTRGMCGFILSFKYSLGYLSAADAFFYEMSFARLFNKANRLVEPTLPAVQSAMNYFSEQGQLVGLLADAEGDASYPIAGYTHLIIHLTAMNNCVSATQLYRYIDWFILDQVPQSTCEELHMASLSTKVGRYVLSFLNENFLCGGRPVRALVEEELAREAVVQQAWRLPVMVAVPITLLVILFCATVLLYQSYQLRRAMRTTHWQISASKLDIRQASKSLVGSTFRNRSRSTVANSTVDIHNTSVNNLSRVMPLLLARYQGNQVTLRPLAIESITEKMKYTFFWALRNIDHVNLSAFYGVAEISDSWYVVSDHFPKGTLYDFLSESDGALEMIFKYSFSIDVASAISYLHKHNLVHGHLSSHNCYLDSKWTLKVGDWIVNTVNQLNVNSLPKKVNEIADAEKEVGSSWNWTKPTWEPPECLLDPSIPPKKHSDVYSLGLLISNIFLGEHPLVSLADGSSGEPVMARIQKLQSLHFPPPAPLKLASVLLSCLAVIPRERPTADELTSVINETNPTTETIMDYMFGKLESKTTELDLAMRNFKTLLHQMLPPVVAEKLSMGEAVEPETYDSVTIYFSDIVGFTSISATSRPLEIVNMLNDLYTTFDAILDKHEVSNAVRLVYKVETIGDAYMVISGLPKRNERAHAAHIANLSIDLACASSTFCIRHRPDERLQLRIGCHSGSVVAGVVGIKMPRYCLFGDTVNTASRMESTSVAMKIQLSETTDNILHQIGGYVTMYRGETSVKGKGRMRTFWLHGRVDQETPMPAPFLRDVTDGD